jgi:hypothetical protein
VYKARLGSRVSRVKQGSKELKAKLGHLDLEEQDCKERQVSKAKQESRDFKEKREQAPKALRVCKARRVWRVLLVIQVCKGKLV